MRTTIAAAHPRTIHAPLAVAECTKAGKQGCFIVTFRAPQSQPIVPTLSTTLRGLDCIDIATLLTDTPSETTRFTKTRTRESLTVTGRAPHSQPIATTYSTTLCGLVCIDLTAPLTTTHTATRLTVATNQILPRTAEVAAMFPSVILCVAGATRVFPSFVLHFKQTWELPSETLLAVHQAIRATIARLNWLLWTMPGDTPPSG